MGATLNSEITVKEGRVNESNFDDYPVVRFNESPQIKVVVLEKNKENFMELESQVSANSACNR